MMDKRIERWETASGVAPRLSTFFSSPEARTVLREFESCENVKGDVEVLAFLLILYVWPETEWKKRRPSPQSLKATARSPEQCSRRVAKLVGTGLLGLPVAVRQTCDQLQQWATHLTAEARGWPMVSIGMYWIGGHSAGGETSSGQTAGCLVSDPLLSDARMLHASLAHHHPVSHSRQTRAFYGNGQAHRDVVVECATA
jgi:hypothetical protein